MRAKENPYDLYRHAPALMRNDAEGEWVRLSEANCHIRDREQTIEQLRATLDAVRELPERWRALAIGWGVEAYDDCADELEAKLEANDE